MPGQISVYFPLCKLGGWVLWADSGRYSRTLHWNLPAELPAIQCYIARWNCAKTVAKQALQAFRLLCWLLPLFKDSYYLSSPSSYPPVASFCANSCESSFEALEQGQSFNVDGGLLQEITRSLRQLETPAKLTAAATSHIGSRTPTLVQKPLLKTS